MPLLAPCHGRRPRRGTFVTILACLAAASAALPAHDPPANLRALDASIKEHPDDPALYYQRGEVLLGIEAPVQALADFERAFALRPDYPLLDLARGRALRALGRHAEAGAAALRELTRDPRCGAAAVLHARSLSALGQHEAALHQWDAALPLVTPAQPEFYLERADAAVSARAVDEALRGLDAAQADLGPVITLQERAIALCEHHGRHAEAVQRLDRVLRDAARPESWLAWKARLLDRLGQPAAAAATRRAALLALENVPAGRAQAPALRALTAGLERALRHAPAVPPTMAHGKAPALPLAAAAASAPSSPAPPFAGSVVLVPRGNWWRYFDAGVDLGTAWRAPAFDDVLWPIGLSQLGFGDGDESWVINGGPPDNRTPTIYFRRSFQVADPTAFLQAHIELLRDDGAVVYLNGTEIARDNLASGPVTYATWAKRSLGGTEERDYVPIPFPASLLVAGTNVVAVEVHQAHAISSDLSFDLELVAAPRLAVSRGPYVQRVTPTAAVVRWRTDVPCGTALWLGTTPGTLAVVHTSAQLRTEHEVVVSNLTPSTRSYYAVGHSTQILAGGTHDHFFCTAPISGTAHPTRIWVLGDSGTADANAHAVRDAYLTFTGTRRTDIVLMLGDNAYYSGTDEEYQRGVFDTYPSILRNTCLWPTLGNHDAIAARTATATGPYYDSFTLPARGEAGGLASGTEAYYAFDHGNVHFVCLDSQDSSRLATGAMLTWLNADLNNCTADWVIAFFHHPPYSKGSHDSDNPFDSDGRMKDMRENALPILEAHGVDLVLTGHSHSYERSFLLNGHYDVSSTLTPQMKLDRGDGNETGDGAYVKTSPGVAPNQGAVYVVAGSAGGLGGGTLNHPAHWIALNELGSLVLDVDGRRLDATFVDATGAVRDRFTVRKGVRRWLVRDEPAISVATGGAQVLALDAGMAHANRDYVLAGSYGTTPGFVRNGHTVPLNPDGWFSTTLAFANSAFLQNSIARLDAGGRGQATIAFPRLSASLAGLELYHAFVVFSGGRVVGASNAVKLRLTP